MECAGGLMFDEESSQCLEKEFVAACGGTPTTTTEATLAADVPAPFPFDCAGKEDADYANPVETCSQWFVSCVGEQPIYRQCGEDLKFDIVADMCLEQEWVASCGGTSTELPETTTVASDPSFNCADQTDGFYANPGESCSDGFFACSGGFTRAMKCAEGLFFDVLSEMCMEREFVVACGGESTTVAPFVPTAQDPPPFPFDCSSKDDGDYENPSEQCSSIYVSCVGEQPFYRLCAGELKFDSVSNECHESEWVTACGGEATVRPPTSTRPSRIGGKRTKPEESASDATAY
jgi:hypothetical protein